MVGINKSIITTYLFKIRKCFMAIYTKVQFDWSFEKKHKSIKTNYINSHEQLLKYILLSYFKCISQQLNKIIILKFFTCIKTIIFPRFYSHRLILNPTGIVYFSGIKSSLCHAPAHKLSPCKN